MLRKLSAAFCLLFTITLTVLADDDTFTQDGVTYKVDASDVSALHVVAGDYSGCVTIPDIVNYKDYDRFVQFIDAQVFKSNKKVKCINVTGFDLNLGAECFWDSSVEYLSLGSVNAGGINSLRGCKLKYLSLGSKLKDIVKTIFDTESLTVETLIIDGIDVSALPDVLPSGVKTVKVTSKLAAAYASKFTSVTVIPFNIINVAQGNEGKFCSFVAGEKLDFTDVTDVEAYTAADDAISTMGAKLELTPITGVVKKNTPLFLLPKKSGKIEIPVASTTLQDTGDGDADENDEYESNAATLIGGNTAMSHYVEDGEHVWAISAADRKLHPIKAGTVLAPGVAYVKVPDHINASLDVISLEIPDETAIVAPPQPSPRGESQGTTHYSLSGTHIETSTPGIHILSNGRKELRR